MGERFGNNKFLLFAIANGLAIGAIFLNSSWLYNRLGESDHYAYLGAAYYFPKSLATLSHHTIIELVPTYIFTAGLYHLFSAKFANLIKDYLFISVFLYMFLSFGLFLTKNFISVFLIAIILSGYYYFLQSIGSDYTDSFIQIFVLAHLFFIKVFFNKKHTLQDIRPTMILLGVLSAMMLSSGIMSIVYLANIFLFFLSLRLFRSESGFYRALCFEMFLWSIGFLASILAISTYLYILNGGYFMRLNVAKLFYFVEGHGQFHPLMEWLPYAAWLILPSAILLFCIGWCFNQKILLHNYFISFLHLVVGKLEINPKEKMPVIKYLESGGIGSFEEWTDFCFIIFTITVSLSLIFIQFIIKQWSLQFMYFSQIGFIYFLALTIILANVLRPDIIKWKIQILVFVTILAVSYCLNLLSHREINYEIIATNFYSGSATIIPWLVFTGMFLFLITAVYVRVIAPPFLIIPIIVFNLFSYSELYGLSCCLDSQKVDFLQTEGSTSEKYFNAHFRISEFLDKIDNDRAADVWFDEKERLGPIFKQVFSMNYFNIIDRSLINKNLPDLRHYPEAFTSAGHEPIVGKNIVVMSENLEKLSSAVSALQATKMTRINYDPFELEIGKAKIFIYNIRY